MSIDFNQAADSVIIGSWNVGAIQTFTMGLWVYIDAFGTPHATDARFLSKASGTAAANHDWMLGQVNSSGQKWRVRFAAGGTTDTFVGSSTMNAGQWYLAICDYDGTNVHLMIDDVTEFDTAHSVGGNMDVTANIINIGNNGTGDNKGPNGLLAEVFVLSQLLTPDQKAALYCGRRITQVGINWAKLEGYWPAHADYIDHSEIHGIDRDGTPNGTTVGTREHAPVGRQRRRKQSWAFKAGVAPAPVTRRHLVMY